MHKASALSLSLSIFLIGTLGLVVGLSGSASADTAPEGKLAGYRMEPARSFLEAPASLPPEGREGPSAFRETPLEQDAFPPPYPVYHWPLGRGLGNGLLVVNYMDHDSTAGRLDYSCGAHTYDGHSGTDYALYNFRLMDQGCPVLAASNGTVAYMGGAAPGAFDRSCTFNWPDDGNWIWVHNGDGTYSEYLHLRKWSLTVNVGDPVTTGQLLGLVGSSGYSTAPHLHFETGDYFNGPYRNRDPYTGPCNTLPSLWLIQEDYQGDDPLHFVDLGVYTDAAVGGNVANTTYCDVWEGIHQPLSFGIHEPHLDLWVQFQGNQGDTFRIEIRKPNGSEWASFNDVLGYDAQFNWFWAYWFWNGNVSPADYGTWTVRALANGAPSHETSFTVGPTTTYGPRLRPAGRSFRISGVVQRDTLRTTPQSPAATYSLLGAPSGVTLVGSVLQVGTSSSQPYRSAFFRVRAADTSARSDTAWYHLVDMSKPVEPSAGLEETLPSSRTLSMRVSPNPSRGGSSLRFDLPEASAVRLDIFDAGGRRVRSVTGGSWPAGSHVLDWDGRDEAGVALPAGAYFARINGAGGRLTQRIVLVR